MCNNMEMIRNGEDGEFVCTKCGRLRDTACEVGWSPWKTDNRRAVVVDWEQNQLS